MPQPLDPNGFQPMPSSAPNPIAGMVQRNPGVFMPGSVGSGFKYLQSQDVSKQRQQESEQHQDIRQQKGFQHEDIARQKTEEFQAGEKETYGPQIPIPGDNTYALQQMRDKLGHFSIARVLKTSAKAASSAASDAQHAMQINTALDRMERMRGTILGTRPGIIAGSIRGYTGELKSTKGGYADYADFGSLSKSLADMIPKALSGRSNQSAIQNALENIVPSFFDTQESFDRKAANIRALFPKSGKGGAFAGATPGTIGSAPLLSKSGRPIVKDPSSPTGYSYADTSTSK